MRKKVMILCLIIIFVGIAIYSFDLFYNNDNVKSNYDKELVLYDNRFLGNASYDTTDFTASKGAGHTIEIGYDNKESSNVKVTLYRYGMFGDKDNVVVFDVLGESQGLGKYKAIKADNSRYYVNIQAENGDNITGYLTVKQIYE